MHRSIRWEDSVEWLSKSFAGEGAFILANKRGGGTNPMTIGWGQVGIVWGKPIFSAFVRTSRYTHECLQQTQSFTISVPRPGELSDALMICGTKSGRDLDKVDACQLELQPAQTVDTPIIGQCGLHYECSILVRSQLEPSDLSDERVKKFYQQIDLHQILLGEIEAVYVTRELDG